MVPRDASVSPPWEPPPIRNSLYERRTQWLGLRQGCSDASPILSYKNQAGQQDRQNRIYTIPYNIAEQGAQHRRHPPNTETRKGWLPGAAAGRRSDTGPHSSQKERILLRVPSRKTIAIASVFQSQQEIAECFAFFGTFFSTTEKKS